MDRHNANKNAPLNEASHRSRGKISGWLGRLKRMSKGNILAVLGVSVGILVPVWQIYFVDLPDITVEISSVKRIDPGDVTVGLKDEGLENLEEFIPNPLRYEYYPDDTKEKKIAPQFTVAELRNILKRAKLFQDNIPNLFEKLHRAIKDIQALLGINVNVNTDFSDDASGKEPAEGRVEKKEAADFEKLESLSIQQYRSWELQTYLDPYLVDFYEKKILEYAVGLDETSDKSILRLVARTLASLLDDLLEAQKELEEKDKKPINLRTIENHIDEIMERLLLTHVTFKVTVSASNSGRVSTSIKQHALLRVYIGVGNYVDLRLTMDRFREHAEVAPNATKVMTFSSSELSAYPEDDRKQINQYWGQSVRSILFVLDTHGTIYASNPIAFSKGLNQKLIYDKLAKEATKPLYYDEN